MEVLSVLWQRGASTVREIHVILNAHKPTGYTTVLKVLQVMTEKGLVERDESNRAHVYRAKIEKEATERHFVKDLLEKVFGGSAAQLVMRVLESKASDAEEIAAVRKVIEEAERSVKK